MPTRCNDIRINEDASRVVVLTDSEFIIYDVSCITARSNRTTHQCVRLCRNGDYGSMRVVLPFYRSSLFLLVSSGYTPGTSPRRLKLWSCSTNTVLYESPSFPSSIIECRINKNFAVVAIDNVSSKSFSPVIIKVFALSTMTHLTSIESISSCIALSTESYLAYIPSPYCDPKSRVGSGSRGDGRAGGFVSIHDCNSHRVINKFEAHQSSVRLMNFNIPNVTKNGVKDLLLVTCSAVGTIVRVFKVPIGERLYSFRHSYTSVSSMCSLSFCSKSTYVLAVSRPSSDSNTGGLLSLSSASSVFSLLSTTAIKTVSAVVNPNSDKGFVNIFYLSHNVSASDEYITSAGNSAGGMCRANDSIVGEVEDDSAYCVVTADDVDIPPAHICNTQPPNAEITADMILTTAVVGWDAACEGMSRHISGGAALGTTVDDAVVGLQHLQSLSHAIFPVVPIGGVSSASDSGGHNGSGTSNSSYKNRGYVDRYDEDEDAYEEEDEHDGNDSKRHYLEQCTPGREEGGDDNGGDAMRHYRGSSITSSNCSIHSSDGRGSFAADTAILPAIFFAYIPCSVIDKTAAPGTALTAALRYSSTTTATTDNSDKSAVETSSAEIPSSTIRTQDRLFLLLCSGMSTCCHTYCLPQPFSNGACGTRNGLPGGAGSEPLQRRDGGLYLYCDLDSLLENESSLLQDDANSPS